MPSCIIQKLPNGNYLTKIACLSQPLFSGESFVQHVDTLRPAIKDFDQEYQLDGEVFSYSGSAQPIFRQEKTQQKYQFFRYIKQAITAPYWLFAIDMDKDIELTLHEAILADFQHYSFYPARRDIHELGPCSRINYWIALASIDKKILLPQQDFNVNRRIAFRRGYCKGKDSPQRPFYWWACGASTQVFRISLLHPFLVNYDREHHGIWYSRYYGEKITWDDASIIDFRQQLTLKNLSDVMVYFRYLEVEKDANVLLVGISPKTFDRTVRITKQQTWPLSAVLSKEVFWPQACLSFQERVSKYRIIDHGFTE